MCAYRLPISFFHGVERFRIVFALDVWDEHGEQGNCQSRAYDVGTHTIQSSSPIPSHHLLLGAFGNMLTIDEVHNSSYSAAGTSKPSSPGRSHYSYSSLTADFDAARHALARPSVPSLIGSFASHIPWKLGWM